jgi:hypothetical protein
MYRNTDLEAVKYHFQELYAEAERNRLIKNSRPFKPADPNRWFIRLFDRITSWAANWRCLLQGRLAQNLFPALNNLAMNPDPCTCAPEPCTQ